MVHITFIHILLAKAQHVATHNFKEAEEIQFYMSSEGRWLEVFGDQHCYELNYVAPPDSRVKS